MKIDFSKKNRSIKYEDEISFVKAIRDFDRQFPNAFWEIIDEPKLLKFGVMASNDKETKEFFIRMKGNYLPAFKEKLRTYLSTCVAFTNAKKDLINNLVGQDVSVIRNKFPSYLRVMK